ncbi:NAD-dependent epimerase/dehydratase family protein [Candidatus Hydrogenosomobacter endosymbioticus]|uniref:dTDP-glucose 4,6-dehydratase n=1 Tax=Candidatus Hydrogenosomobacter endosymbioticus TaxID=2558174 RepID=A0ABM7VAJ6_9PROT|nr:NAD-dependent epimerase/dehydratase family protein [Candidatus Hydrogenosomobacter endosymbioticus]BDB96582.1 dTDP-glucose 4,6-dehydratase [Candidatus Hydrogenosomobacter endosymbioticus]
MTVGNYSIHSDVIREDLELSVGSSSIDWELIDGATIVIAGATGMIASFLIDTLLYAKYTGRINDVNIVAICRDELKARARFGPNFNLKEMQFIFRDITDSLIDLNASDYIIHAASHVGPMYYKTNPIGILDANIIGTKNMLELAKKSEAKSFLYISSCEVYGIIPPDVDSVRESDFCHSPLMSERSCYGDGKRAGEAMCYSYFVQHGIPVRSARFSQTYGPFMDLNSGIASADFISSVLRRENITVRSRGFFRTFCYVSDAVTGILAILLRGKSGEAYNIGNAHQVYDILEIARIIAALFPEKGVQVISEGTPEQVASRVVPDTSKLESLGWLPKIAVDSGFRRSIEFFEKFAKDSQCPA